MFRNSVRAVTLGLFCAALLIGPARSQEDRRLSLSLHDADSTDIERASPLHDLIMNRAELRRMEELLNDGTSPDAKDVDGQPALHCAIAYGAPDVVELLLRRGADVNLKDINGCTPLALLVHMGYPDRRMLELLLQHGADINAPEEPYGYTPLDNAVSCGYDKMAALLKARGAVHSDAYLRRQLLWSLLLWAPFVLILIPLPLTLSIPTRRFADVLFALIELALLVCSFSMLLAPDPGWTHFVAPLSAATIAVPLFAGFRFRRTTPVIGSLVGFLLGLITSALLSRALTELAQWAFDFRNEAGFILIFVPITLVPIGVVGGSLGGLVAARRWKKRREAQAASAVTPTSVAPDDATEND